MKRAWVVLLLTAVIGWVTGYSKPAAFLDAVPEDIVCFGVLPKLDAALEVLAMMEEDAAEEINMMKPFINSSLPLLFFLNNPQMGFDFNEISEDDLVILVPVVSAKKKDMLKYIEDNLANDKIKEKNGVIQAGDVFMTWLPGDYLAIAPVKENIDYIKKAKSVSKSKIDNAKNAAEFTDTIGSSLVAVFLNGKVINDSMGGDSGMMSQYEVDVRYAAAYLTGDIDFENYQLGGEIALSTKLFLKDGKALKEIFLMDDKADKGIKYIPAKPIGMIELNIKPEILSLASMFAMGMVGMDLSTLGWDMITGNLALALYPQPGEQDFNDCEMPQILAFITTAKAKDGEVLLQNFLTMFQEMEPSVDLNEVTVKGSKAYQLVGTDSSDVYFMPISTGLVIAIGEDVLGLYVDSAKKKDTKVYTAASKQDPKAFSVLNIFIESEQLAQTLSEQAGPFGNMIDLKKLLIQLNISKDMKVVEFKFSLNQ
ncbi:MAG: hypothetical protein A2Y33_01190 [Spirochaetes bacterium GWF1_51_8]|nr:MAG: hypothetical protein A2Y33_01190 [Spirochaetes bacterium GWF1_51_8]